MTTALVAVDSSSRWRAKKQRKEFRQVHVFILCGAVKCLIPVSAGRESFCGLTKRVQDMAASELYSKVGKLNYPAHSQRFPQANVSLVISVSDGGLMLLVQDSNIYVLCFLQCFFICLLLKIRSIHPYETHIC